jgi:hypothetical protein
LNPYLTIGEKHTRKSERLLGNVILFIDDSILPELMIMMGFIFLAFTRLAL